MLKQLLIETAVEIQFYTYTTAVNFLMKYLNVIAWAYCVNIGIIKPV